MEVAMDKITFDFEKITDTTKTAIIASIIKTYTIIAVSEVKNVNISS
jgi:hypothetical protein